MDESVADVDIAVVRRLALLGARIAAHHDLHDTFQAVVDGVVDVLGFGGAVLNLKRDDGDYEVVAASGPASVADTLLGTIQSAGAFEALLDLAEPWGPLLYLGPDHETELLGITAWSPDIAVPMPDDLDAWHPDASLFAPVRGENGALLGALSVDLPPGNRRPSSRLIELLGIFALQVGVALAAATDRERERIAVRRRERRLVREARQDHLTGLAVRSVLESRLGRAVIDAGATGETGAVFFCDIDGFKAVNDRYGHGVGDDMLQRCALHLTSSVRPDDLVVRYGGDEFVVVAECISPDDAERMADRIRRPRLDDSRMVGVSMSVGIVVLDGGSEPDELLRLADEAMYADKGGREPAVRD